MGSRRKFHERRAKTDFLKWHTPGRRILTFRTRTAHIDRFVLRLFGLKRFRGKELKVLDLGVAPLERGAPTTEETCRALAKAGIKPKIVAVDKEFPEPFRPRVAEIEYRNADINVLKPFGKFDYIKATSVFSGIEDRRAFRSLVLESLNEGGIVVTTPDKKNPLIDFKRHPPETIPLRGKGHFIYLVLQKKGGRLEPIARIGTGPALTDRTARYWRKTPKRKKQGGGAQTI